MRRSPQVNPTAAVVEARSSLALEGGEIRGRTVAVVEDGPTLTHGGMTYGAGVVAAKRFGATEIVDPRPYATGELAATLAKYPKLEHLLPARVRREADPRARGGAHRDPGRRRPRGDADRSDPGPLDPQADRPRPVRARAVTGNLDEALAPVIARAKGALAGPADIRTAAGPIRARCGSARSIPGREPEGRASVDGAAACGDAVVTGAALAPTLPGSDNVVVLTGRADGSSDGLTVETADWSYGGGSASDGWTRPARSTTAATGLRPRGSVTDGALRGDRGHRRRQHVAPDRVAGLPMVAVGDGPRRLLGLLLRLLVAARRASRASTTWTWRTAPAWRSGSA